MKSALYGSLAGLVAGLLVLTFLFLGPLSNSSTPEQSMTSAPQSASPSPTPEPSQTQEPVDTEVAKCSVSDAATAEGILTLEAQVLDTATGEVLFDRLGAVPSQTASVLKLATAAAALESLGADYKVTTRVYADAVDPSIIYLVGAGDVTLSRSGVGAQSVYRNAPKLFDLAKQVASNSGSEAITQIILDSSLYGGESGEWKADWDIKGLKEGYMSNVSALQVDGDRTVASSKDSPRSTDPVTRAGKWFKEALGQTATGAKISKGIAPADALEIAKVTSRPISEWISYMLLVSDNTLAEALGRLVSLDQGLDGSFSSLNAAYKKALSSTGLELSSLKIEDGSGLSDYNQASPALINSLLGLIDSNYGSFAVIKSGMPVAGSAGSLAYRLTDAQGMITAKTGWIQSGYTIAGFMDTPDGAHLIFSVFNLGKVSAANRDAMDDLVMAIYDCGGSLGNE